MRSQPDGELLRACFQFCLLSQYSFRLLLECIQLLVVLRFLSHESCLSRFYELSAELLSPDAEQSQQPISLSEHYLQLFQTLLTSNFNLVELILYGLDAEMDGHRLLSVSKSFVLDQQVECNSQSRGSGRDEH